MNFKRLIEAIVYTILKIIFGLIFASIAFSLVGGILYLIYYIGYKVVGIPISICILLFLGMIINEYQELGRKK